MVGTQLKNAFSIAVDDSLLAWLNELATERHTSRANAARYGLRIARKVLQQRKRRAKGAE